MLRCPAHFQGDRCRVDHGGLDEIIHRSQFHIWKDGDKTDELKPDPRNSRQAKRDLKRLLELKGSVKRTPEARQFYSIALKNVESFFRLQPGVDHGRHEGSAEQS